MSYIVLVKGLSGKLWLQSQLLRTREEAEARQKIMAKVYPGAEVSIEERDERL